MSELKIASRYAKALFLKAQEDGVLDAVMKDMQELTDLSNDSHEFIVFLDSPLYNISVKKEAVLKLTEKQNGLSRGVYSLMVDKKRESYIPAMAKSFIAMYNEAKKIVQVEVNSAVELSKSTLSDIEKYVKSITDSKSVDVKTNIDTSVVGGLTIEFDGKIFDSTVSTQINKIKKELQIA
jgi:F-type H+-transporting ATPase subunit delta